GRRLPVRLLPRLRVDRGVLALPHHPVLRDGHHRRHGLAARRPARQRVRHPVPLPDRRHAACAARRRALRQRPCRREPGGVRRGDDPVSAVRAARPRRHLAAHPELLPAMAVPLPAGRRRREMTLLAVDKLAVVYQRAITAVQGISLGVERGQIVALLGTNGAGKTTTLRAISGFLGLDDARVTEGAITFMGERIDNLPPHEVTRRGIALVPEREKVFPNLTVTE